MSNRFSVLLYHFAQSGFTVTINDAVALLPAATLSDADSKTPTFTAPDVDANGDTLTFELTVTDNHGATSTDTLQVSVMM